MCFFMQSYAQNNEGYAQFLIMLNTAIFRYKNLKKSCPEAHLWRTVQLFRLSIGVHDVNLRQLVQPRHADPIEMLLVKGKVWS